MDKPNDTMAINELCERYDNALESDAFSDGDLSFLPYGKVDSLLGGDIVERILGQGPETVNLVQFVMNEQKPAKKIFVLCVRAGFEGDALCDLLLKFQAAAFADHSLPVTDENRKQLPFLSDEDETWVGINTENLETEQYELFAPVFCDDMQDVIRLSKSSPLPFIDCKKECSRGGFAVVHQATVHHSHLRHRAFGTYGRSGDVALKQIWRGGSNREGSFERECAFYHRDCPKHPHLIDFIAAIQRGADERYLLFRWANGKDLAAFWQMHPKPVRTEELIHAALTQITGLADVLVYLHEFPGTLHYRHTDIKPSNILRSVQDADHDSDKIGLLQLADLGLARGHVESTGQRRGTEARAATRRYLAPEAVPVMEGSSRDNGTLSRRYDVWSLGAVMLEFVLWLVGGADLLDRFAHGGLHEQQGASNLPLYESGHQNDTAVVHRVVVDTIKSLLEEPACQPETALGDLVRLVRDRMLVVSLEESQHGRATSTEVLKKLREICDREDSCYWSASTASSRAAQLIIPATLGADLAANPPIISLHPADGDQPQELFVPPLLPSNIMTQSNSEVGG